MEKETNKAANMVDPLLLTNSDFPGMTLTSQPFDTRKLPGVESPGGASAHS